MDRIRRHFAYFEKNVDSAFFRHNGNQTTMNQNGRVNFFECLRPKLTIFEVKASIHRLAYGTIARTHRMMNANKKNAFKNDHFILVEDIYRNTVLHSFARQNKNKCHVIILQKKTEFG